MRKLSNEVKVGIITLLTIIVFIWLFQFLKGKNVLTKDAVYYSVYDKVGGLAESSPVEVNGYKVGVVQAISFIDANSGRLLVRFSIDRRFKIPKNTVAEIVPVSILGGMKVQFVYGEGPGFYEHNDTIPGKLGQSISTIMDEELVPLKNRLTHLIAEVDSVITSVNGIVDENFRNDLGQTLSNLNNTTGSLKNIVTSREQELKSTLDNLNKFSKMLSDNTGNLNETFSNLASISDTLQAADIYNTINNLKSGLENTSALIDNMNKGKGSAGQFLTNDSVYINLNNSLESLNLLLEDLKANPKRYVHFSVFGKKDKLQ
jgi:phospholipid/cholesterol/gamma-HCH transport system substrate-binding protein